jgi:hypothetical protein
MSQKHHCCVTCTLRKVAVTAATPELAPAPAPAPAAAPQTPPAAFWVLHKSNNDRPGCTYWFNHQTGEAVWAEDAGKPGSPLPAALQPKALLLC